ncbi:hypothetical protein DFH07DRAFT_943655 [Mycena maculata]|uniref:Uncharacterized protein n=1 Tax=Mycena maculata TaxID=230809 RepID=A0AAD7IG16_9AGAR|nr:hypothetical protein DFH07DRAFT_943655 [Mycena maculata]
MRPTSTSRFTDAADVIDDWVTLVPDRQGVLGSPGEYIWVLPAPPTSLAVTTLAQFPIMIRQEYDDLLMAILSSLDRQKRDRERVRRLREDQAKISPSQSSWLTCSIRPKEEGDLDSSMDVDDVMIKEEPVDPDLTAPLRLRIKRRPKNLSEYKQASTITPQLTTFSSAATFSWNSDYNPAGVCPALIASARWRPCVYRQVGLRTIGGGGTEGGAMAAAMCTMGGTTKAGVLLVFGDDEGKGRHATHSYEFWRFPSFGDLRDKAAAADVAVTTAGHPGEGGER